MLLKIIAIVLCLVTGWLILHYGMVRYQLNNWVVLLITLDIFVLFLLFQLLYNSRLSVFGVAAAGWFAIMTGLGTIFSRQRLLRHAAHLDDQQISQEKSQ